MTAHIEADSDTRVKTSSESCNGEIWRLEVSRLNKKQAQAVVHAVGS